MIYTPRSPPSYLGIVIWFCVRFAKHLGGGEFTWRKARFFLMKWFVAENQQKKRNTIAPLLFETWKVHQQLLLLSRESDRINLESNLSGIQICKIYFFFGMAWMIGLCWRCVCVYVFVDWICRLHFQFSFFVGGHHKVIIFLKCVTFTPATSNCF